jgi:VWFA-related protein
MRSERAGSSYVGAALVLAATTAALAQQPVFRAGVDYVAVDVVVTDSQDRPLIDLTRADFTILEHDKLQAITDVQFVSVPLAQRTLEVTRPATPEPDVSTNLPPTPKSRLFVMIVDDLHIIESDIIAVKRVMTDFLQAISPDDQVAIVFVSHSNFSQNFTTDRTALLKTVDRVRGALGFGLDALGRSISTDLVRDPVVQNRYAREADSVLKNVAQSLAGSGHSRRAIIYVTSGAIMTTGPPAPGGPPTDYEYITDVFETARRADVPIYTLDPRGQVLAEDAVRGGISVIHNETIRAQVAANIRVQQERLAEIAINTGGRAFTNASNLTRAVDEIVAENGSYYLLGYYPDPVVHDGKFHEITVHVNRPGARVRARSGYVAAATGPAVTSAKQTLDAAMGAGVNVSALSLRAFAAPVAAGAKGMKTVVTVEVSYPAPVDGSRRINDELQVSVLALDPDAKVKASSAHALHFTGTTPSQSAVTFVVDDLIELPSQALTLRVGVASQALGKAGTIQIPIEVPRPSDGRLQLGGVVLGFAGPARQAAMRAETLTGVVPFQPTTTRTFAATDTLHVFVPLFWASKDRSATVRLAVRRGDAVVGQRTEPVTSTATTGDHQQATFTGNLPLTGLTAGNYVLAVEARLANGQAAKREVAIDVR